MSFFGISSRNKAQKAAMQALTNDKPFTFLTGPAGTGKTLITQAVGLEHVIEEQRFRKLNYTRLQTQVGMDVGALPGDINEKTHPFVAPFWDNLEVMCDKPSEIAKMFIENDSKRKIYFDPIQMVRGRSIHSSFAMFDEAQNLDVHTFSGVATRIPVGSKFVFLGNFSQIDDPKLRNIHSNGLYQLLQGFYQEEAYEYFDHINLTSIERHPVVTIVEKILRDHDPIPQFEELEAKGNIIY